MNPRSDSHRMLGCLLVGLAFGGMARAIPPTPLAGSPAEYSGFFPATEQDIAPITRFLVLGHRPVVFDYTVPDTGAYEVHLAEPWPALSTFEKSTPTSSSWNIKDVTQDIRPPYPRLPSVRVPWYLPGPNLGRATAFSGDVLRFAVAVPHAVWTNTVDRGFAFQITPFGTGIATNLTETLAATGFPAELVVNASLSPRAGQWTAGPAGHVEARGLMLGGATVTLRRPGGQVVGVLRGDMNWARFQVSSGEVIRAEAAVASGRGRARVSFHSIGAPPANSTPETAQILAGNSVSVNAGSTANAPATGRGLPSRWYAWTAPETAVYLFKSTGSAVPATIQVYRGGARVADSGSVVFDVFNTSIPASVPNVPYALILGNGHASYGADRVAVGLEAGVEYRVGIGSAPGATGALSLSIAKLDPVQPYIVEQYATTPTSTQVRVGFSTTEQWFYRGWYSQDLVNWSPILSDEIPGRPDLFYSWTGHEMYNDGKTEVLHFLRTPAPVSRLYYKFLPFQDGFGPGIHDHVISL